MHCKGFSDVTFTAHNTTLSNAHEAYALMLLGELYCGQGLVLTPNTNNTGIVENCNVLVSVDDLAQCCIAHGSSESILYAGVLEYVFNSACKVVVCASNGYFAFTQGNSVPLPPNTLIADFFGYVTTTAQEPALQISQGSQGEDEAAWREMVRTYNVYGPQMLKLFDDFLQVWVINSPEGIEFLESECKRTDFALSDFIEACCWASNTIMQDWSAQEIFRGFTHETSCGNNISVRVLSSWTTDHAVTQYFATESFGKKPFVFKSTIKDVQVLVHHAFCAKLNEDLREDEVIVASTRKMIPALNLSRPMCRIGEGVDAEVFEQAESPSVIVRCKNESKARLLDIFCKCNLKALPRVRKIHAGVYEMERLYFFGGILQDQDALQVLSDSYKNIAKLSDDFEALQDNDIKEALQYLRKALRGQRYRLDLHSGNIMQRKNGDVVLVDPLISLKYTSQEWARKQAQLIDEAW